MKRGSVIILLAAAAWVAPMLAAAPANGLRGHWAMDDPAGSFYAADNSPDLNHAFCGTSGDYGYVCPTFADPGTMGTAVTFNGNSFLEVHNSIPNSFTIAAWIKTTQDGGGWGPAFSGTGVIWADVGGGGPDMIPMAIVNGNLAFGTGENCGVGYDTLTSTVPVNTGQWVHVAVTRDTTTGGKQLYINGVLNNTNFNGGCGSLNYNYRGAIAFGANWLDHRFFSGQMDDVYFYDRVLSPAEVQSLIPPPPPATQIADLATAVNNLVTTAGLSSGNAGALTAKLDAALQQIANGNTTAAKNELNAFTNQVRALLNSRRLTSAQAQALIDAANAAAAGLS
jgi:concanavalin A-like lectin/glucanase superfamily protein/FIMAH domain-containing protein